MAFSPDEQTLACVTASRISLVDVRTGRTLASGPVSDLESVDRLWFSPDGRLLAATGPARLRLIRVSDAQVLLDQPVATDAVGFDGTTLRYLADATVVSLDVTGLLDPVRLPGPVPDTELFSPDGRLLVTHKAGSRAMMLRDPRGRVVGTPLPMEADSMIRDPAFSGDGGLLAFTDGRSRDYVSLWDTTRRTRVAKIPIPDMWYPHSLAMAPDGATLAIGVSAVVDPSRARLLIWDVRQARWSRSIGRVGEVEVVFRPGSTMVAESQADPTACWTFRREGRPVRPSDRRGCGALR
ncbi:WD40 repeat domain-containing protein [Sphaerisporangium sp. TRM90804]|uniref:WD40 repeat domain-containing protein n=1 Tax=Sphaerisporangium sp. TRM90804 TaxID=3031113 RepID=UPI002447E163|nr:WD40 repeat domain-containing protein [Sphaerisporangium sp. TRM90804]MDH2426835.1 WD40 repeat domain-containing protein [Sphaerisporangium sp. TRM90804]